MKRSDPSLFKGRHFDKQVIILCVRCYLGDKLNSRDLVVRMNRFGDTGQLRRFPAGSEKGGG
jgi:hypothetical protein